MDNPILLTAKEASDMLRVPLSTLYRLTKQGQIRGFKIGKQWRYRKEEVSKYFNAGFNFIQRRRYTRINCNIASNFGIIKNISAGGVFLESVSDSINVNDPIHLNFTLKLNDDESMLVEKDARVVRRDEQNFGITFDRPLMALESR